MNRRMALLGLAALAGCGFELRKEPEFLFHTVGLAGFRDDSQLAVELRRQIGRTKLTLQPDFNRAEVVVESLKDQRDKIVVVSTSVGQVREWQLKLDVDYLLRTAQGELLLPRTELRLTRELTYTETQALGKEQEEAQLYRAMQSDAVALIMRRLAAVKLPS
ncbi:LPS assembly lipoprotein LptE [Pelomonas sp. KK5]|uniref:LPS-assembly lipoprotein LptE n=1 Tax=Pelomonas sp. KK5 TaxID=1855730 RepID=UPI00097C5658|nr:LPS assembly lipoprotein LptE [Pelomonas sp. KK5]